MKNLFIGIDFSKKTFDVSFFEKNGTGEVFYSQFENNKDGFKNLVKWISQHTDVCKEEWLFCGEHTGLYSLELLAFLLKPSIYLA